MTKVSVVVPVYNVERYLCECLNSVRAQTLRDIEILCVDDGSTDRCPELLSLYERLDSRIRVFSTENRGVSAARNTGIDAATGDYLMFVDADDILEPIACEVVCKKLDNAKYDLIKFSARPFPSELSNPWLEGVTSLPEQEFVQYDDDMMFFSPCRPFIWNGAYRRSFLNEKNIRFIEGLPLGEDQVFSFATIGRMRSCAFFSDCLYHYRVSRLDSATLYHSENRVNKLWEHMRVYEAIIDDWLHQGHMSGYSARRMIYFGLDFLLPDIFRVEEEGVRCELLNHFRDILLYRFSREQIVSWMEQDPLRFWAVAVCDFDGDSSTFDREANYRYIEDRSGLEAAEQHRVDDMLAEERKRLGVFDRVCCKLMGETLPQRKERVHTERLLRLCDEKADAALASFICEARSAGLKVGDFTHA